MFLFAWSLALNAVEYARRQRVIRLVTRFFEETALLGECATLVCRPVKKNCLKEAQTTAQLIINIFDTETVLSLYNSKECEIVVKYEKVFMQSKAWYFCPAYAHSEVKYHKSRISFIARLALFRCSKNRFAEKSWHYESPTQTNSNARIEKPEENLNDNLSNEEEESLHLENKTNFQIDLIEKQEDDDMGHDIDEHAHFIAQHRKSRHLLYYECTLTEFYDIVYFWMQGKLYKGDLAIEEIYTVEPPSTSLQIHFTDKISENRGLCQKDLVKRELSSSSLSLASNSNNSEMNPPYSLLEMLYLKELFGVNNNVSADFLSQNRWNNFCSEICLDTATKHNFIAGLANELSSFRSYREVYRSLSPQHTKLRTKQNKRTDKQQRFPSLSPTRLANKSNALTNFSDSYNYLASSPLKTLYSSSFNRKVSHSHNTFPLSPLTPSAIVVPNYFRSLREGKDENTVSSATSDITIDNFEESNFEEDNSQASKNLPYCSLPTTISDLSTNEADEIMGASTTSMSCFVDGDLTSVLEGSRFPSESNVEGTSESELLTPKINYSEEEETLPLCMEDKSKLDAIIIGAECISNFNGDKENHAKETPVEDMHFAVTGCDYDNVKLAMLKRQSTVEFLPKTHAAKSTNLNRQQETKSSTLQFPTLKKPLLKTCEKRNSSLTNLNSNFSGYFARPNRQIFTFNRPFIMRKRFVSLTGGENETARFPLLSRCLGNFNKNDRCGRISMPTISLNHRAPSPVYATDFTVLNKRIDHFFDRSTVRRSARGLLFTSERTRRSQSFSHKISIFNNSSVRGMCSTVRNNETGNSNTPDQKTNENANVARNLRTGSLQKITRRFEKLSAKPPSILVYTGDCAELYKALAALLAEILPRDIYAVRDLSTRALKFYPWNIRENCACLIVASTAELDDFAWAKLQHYFNNLGKMLFVCQNALLSDLTRCGSVKKRVNLLKSIFERKAAGGIFGKDFELFLKKAVRLLEKDKEVNEVFHTKDNTSGYQVAVVLSKKIEQPFLLYMQTMENQQIRSCALFSDSTTDQLLNSSELITDALSRLGVSVYSQLHMDNTSIQIAKSNDNSQKIPPLTPGFLICQRDRLILDIKNMTYDELYPTKLGLIFQHISRKDDEDVTPLPEPSISVLPIFVCRRTDVALSEHFDHCAYFDMIKTKRLGRILVYVPVCTTTIEVAKSFSTAFPESDGILISGGYQLHGRGRSGNVWLSPRGCATLQFNFNIPVDSTLGKSTTFIQHILAVAIVDALLTRVNDQNFPIKIKWPNDIYYQRDFKLGGILVSATHRSPRFECSIAAGVNISNSKPTVCVNNFLPAEKALKIEEFLAETMNKFEYYVNVFVNRGKDEFIRHYLQYWMHKDEEVTIIHEGTGKRERVFIRGLDENGFLKVEGKLTNRIFSVQDDGNSFDVMHGLIHPKEYGS